MNKVILIGRLSKDAELKYTPGAGTAVSTFTIAVDNYNSKEKKNEADFIPIVLWGKRAESLATYLTKGTQVAVAGRISVRSYEAKDGSKRYVTEVVADMFNGVTLLGGKKSNDSSSNNNTGAWNQSDNLGMGFGEEEPMDFGDMPF